MRRVAYLFGGSAAAGAGVYVVVYLYRWQWQRAILCGVLLLVVEVMLLGIVLLGRLSRIEERIEERMRETDRRPEDALARPHRQDTSGRSPQEDVLARLRQGEPSNDRFRWLDDPSSHSYVFVPVLMVTGVLLSGLAWLVQRIASVTARPSAERRLAGRLAILAAPDAVGNTDLDDLPPIGARRDRGRTVRLVAAGVVGAVLLTALVGALAELTQTREEHGNDSEATSVLVRIDMRGKDMTAERGTLAAHQLWERCRDSTSVPLSRATLGSLGDGLYAGVVRPALTDHDRMRLTGCLEDASLDRTHLTVVGIGDTDADDD
ncbi:MULTISPECIES: hypothetical protein [unclassified Streptomyces]|uniref:hypothetical protein n=1 Tax=unclassified Streptomyces TaxID=2593676 RepID=UPI002DD89F20|nr:hypothetical protein [Streptomyces sp. NBC_00243]WRZ23344.1 hypothetical protein OHT59_35030 [Streptomyces sp. NBC_00243]